MPSIVGGLDIHRKQITFDYLDLVTGEVTRGQIAPADRVQLRAWLARFEHPGEAAFAAEACTGWRYVILRREALFVRVEVRDLRLRPVAAGR
jgi:transposase